MSAATTAFAWGFLGGLLAVLAVGVIAIVAVLLLVKPVFPKDEPEMPA